MAITRKVRGASIRKTERKPSSRAPRQTAVDVSDCKLPSGINEPPDSMFAYSLFIYGPKGIGKSSLAAQFPDSMLMQFEPGRRNLRVRQVPKCDKHGKPVEPPLDWARFKKYQDLILSEGKVKSVGIDTADRAYEACLQYICKQRGFDYPPETDFGKTWSAIKREYEDTMNLWQFNGITPVFISHERKVMTKAKYKAKDYDEWIPTLSDAPFRYIKASCDLVIHYGYIRKNMRVFTVRGNERVFCSCGVDGHFLSPERGCPPVAIIPAGPTAEAAFKNLLASFNNKVQPIEYAVEDSGDYEEEESEE